MPLKNIKYLCIVTPLILASFGASAQVRKTAEDSTVKVQTKNQNGVCTVYFPRGSMELQISVKASNNNVNVGVDDLPAELVEAGVNKAHVPITLEFANGKKVKTDDGAYRAGFQYRVSGYWKNEKNGAPLLAYLKGGESITAKFDGQSFGPFEIQQSTGMFAGDYAYKWLKKCITDNGGSPNF
jgi:hypothetical protein